MNDDEEFERRLSGAFPQQPSAELRERILSRVSQELRTLPERRRSWGWAVAAMVLIALGLNVLSSMAVDHRVAVYRETEQAPLSDLDHRSDVDPASVLPTTAPWMAWAQTEPATRREDFERYMSELITRTSNNDMRYLP